MSNATVSYIGSSNDTTPSTTALERALFLKVFSGEVLMAFEEYNMFLDKHSVRSIKSGKQAQFPLFGRMPDAEYHTPGAEIVGQQIPMAEKTIDIDKLLISHVFIPVLDDAISHYDVRGKYADMCGKKLANTFDNHVARELLLAAASSTPITGDSTMGGKIVNDAEFGSATAATKLAAWVDGLFDAAAHLDNRWVTGKRYCVTTPAYYYFLVQQMTSNGFSLIHKDIDGRGSISDGTLTKVAGIEMLAFPGLPTSDYSSETYHNVNASNTVGIIFTPDAVGTVKLLDLNVESEWDIRRQGWLTVAKYAMGHGVLQGECAYHLRTSAP
jgi:hypothetical protein